MMKFILFILISICLPDSLVAQAYYQSVIASDGGAAKSETMSLDWTLGEPVIESGHTSKRMYTQGFHQPTLKVKDVKQTITPRSENLEITAIPNPVSSFLTLNLNSVPDSEIEVFISDGMGQTVRTETINPAISTTEIDLSNLATGLYVLRVYNQDKELLKTFKISKIQ